MGTLKDPVGYRRGSVQENLGVPAMSLALASEGQSEKACFSSSEKQCKKSNLQMLTN